MFTERSIVHLRAVFEELEKLLDSDLEGVLSKYVRGDTEKYLQKFGELHIEYIACHCFMFGKWKAQYSDESSHFVLAKMLCYRVLQQGIITDGFECSFIEESRGKIIHFIFADHVHLLPFTGKAVFSKKLYRRYCHFLAREKHLLF